MCGTSQDGLDLADVRFTFLNGDWSFELIYGVTLPLPRELRERLSQAPSASALELAHLDKDLALFSGMCVNDYLKRSGSNAAFIGSHGVTIFHQPENGFTTQIGSGAVIAATSGLTTICDFRQQDVSKGGQGAPLVPSCDRLLFSSYDHTLNLGGFANIAILAKEVKGFDVCACNLVLNHLMRDQKQDFDDSGRIASAGKLVSGLFEDLESLPYFKGIPTSLGSEWFIRAVLPILEKAKHAAVADRLFTASEHIATRIAARIQKAERVLVTGGGAHNDHLVRRIRALSNAKIEVPEQALVDMKEAICFAFLGLLRLEERVNIYASSTGAKADSTVGAVYLP